MIAKLLRRDPMVAVQLPVFVIVAGLVGSLGGVLMRTASQFVELSARASEAHQIDMDPGLLMTAMLGAQALAIAVILCGRQAYLWDGVQPHVRSQPMELMLPIAPRAAWCARLIAHGIAIAVPLLTTLLVFLVMDERDSLLALWKVAAAAAVVVFFVFGCSPEQAAPRGRSFVVGIVLVLLGSGLLLAFDLGVLEDALSTGPRFGLEVALAVASVWSVRAYRRLPLSWDLSDNRSKALTRAARPALGESATGPRGRSGTRPPAWRAANWCVTTWATVGPFRIFGLSAVGCLGAWLTWFAREQVTTWVPVLWAAGLVAFAARMLLMNARFLTTLPISRRRLLGAILGPLACGVALGCALGFGFGEGSKGTRPMVTMDDQVQKRSVIDPDRPHFQHDSWMDVVVPLRHWRVAAFDGVPEQVAPDGERATPRAVHPLGLGFLTVYNPYDAPLGCSRAFTGWQFSRALHAEHGVSVDSAELSERYLQTTTFGQVGFSSAQVARAVADNKLGTRPWNGTLGTLVDDYPETAHRWDARRAALPVLAAVVLAAVLGSLLLRLRDGTWTCKVALFLFPMFVAVAFSLDLMLKLWLGPEHPQVLFAIAGETLLSWLPDVAWVVWLLTIATAAVGFLALSRALDRAEYIARKGPRLHSAG